MKINLKRHALDNRLCPQFCGFGPEHPIHLSGPASHQRHSNPREASLRHSGSTTGWTMKIKLFRFLALGLLLSLGSQLSTVRAGQIDIPAPGGSSGLFGTNVTVLPNGNFVVTDPGYDVFGTNDIGAVYLY